MPPGAGLDHVGMTGQFSDQGGRHLPPRITAELDFPQSHQPVHGMSGNRIQHRFVGQTEHRRRPADAQRKNQYREQRRSLVLPQLADSQGAFVLTPAVLECGAQHRFRLPRAVRGARVLAPGRSSEPSARVRPRRLSVAVNGFRRGPIRTEAHFGKSRQC
jgi:hypothetical protein